ncbi:hypothetical protein [Candidatus Poriferisodalis sp.]|uniref:hypothetical protein n=1 Tax=Candidatus Poriferisodalis sp. TaxID=3101277 RepID=UPI003B01E5CE
MGEAMTGHHRWGGVQQVQAAEPDDRLATTDLRARRRLNHAGVKSQNNYQNFSKLTQ